MNIGGPLQPNASNGNTGVFINGRQLHMMDTIAFLQHTGRPAIPGRWWVDAMGNCGMEGNPIPLMNLVAVSKMSGGGLVNHLTN